MPSRIHVIGGGGSGKTTLARRVAAALGLPIFELDTPDADLTDLVQQPQWVSEGIYLYGIQSVLDRADLIVWLDLPRRVAIWRIFTRHIRLSARGVNPHPGFRRMLDFAWGQREYYTSPPRQPTHATDWDALSRAATAELLEPRSAKVVHLRSPRQVRRWLRSMGSAERT